MKDNKRLLIFMKTGELKPTGGPAGYNYNLKKELDKMNIEGIEFIESAKGVDLSKTFTKNHLLKKVRRIIGIFRRTLFYSKLLLKSEVSNKIENNEYDMIHFHFTEDIFRYRKSLERYSGKVILTSHSPTLASLQIFDTLTKFEKIIFKALYKKLQIMDYFAFERADYIIFPCPEAEEPYYNNWEGYKEFKEKNRHKYRYLLTGINRCETKIKREDVRKTYHIPEDAFVISYAGRHNTIKGYDLLKEMGKELLYDKNVYFLVAGNEEPLKGIDNERWIEIGWTSDPHSFISASDLFVLPNRETYFDLVLLEVISLGIPVVASRTGGNKYFRGSTGIILFDDVKEAIESIRKVMKMSKQDRKRMGDSNRELFEKNYNCQVFAKAYIRLIDELEC